MSKAGSRWALVVGIGLIVGLLAWGGLTTVAFAQGPGSSWGHGGMMGGPGGMSWGTNRSGWNLGGMMGDWGRGLWNGMMGGWWGAPSGPMTVTTEQALANAQAWLDGNLPGTTVDEHADAFYGYYTIHTLYDGEIEGMLSVNGYTGDVWYHNWHGDFIGMQEFEHHGE